ncbi:MAG: metallophosphoesterase [Deltaproteobacteria bacterium]|nr:metallophosphoesterase [Deltaproteobacteria bacterium]
MRVLFVSDTHVGIDTPSRRRRGAVEPIGDPHLTSFERALEPALSGWIDVVVHGGDLLAHSRLPLGVVDRALEPLRRVADAGVHVLLVPGNHERSDIPYPLLAVHPRIHVFRAPRTVVVTRGTSRFAFGGFPYYRGGVRERFRSLVAETRLDAADADARVLCMHHCVEASSCGVFRWRVTSADGAREPASSSFTFTSQPDVVRARDLPARAAVVLSGHIHRHQLVARDLAGRRLSTPVLYAGSVERTSLAESNETKGYVLLALAPGDGGAGRVVRWVFRPLSVEALTPFTGARRVATSPSPAIAGSGSLGIGARSSVAYPLRR